MYHKPALLQGWLFSAQELWQKLQKMVKKPVVSHSLKNKIIKKLSHMSCLGRLFIVLILMSATACSSLVSSAKKQFAEDLSQTIVNYDDPETVRQALPAYLVLVSSLIRSDEENVGLLISGSRLYGAYASVFVDEPERKIVLSEMAFEYAERAVCLTRQGACEARALSYSGYEQLLNQFTREQVNVLFAYGAAWAGWIQANRGDWNAVAELPRVKATIGRVLVLDETISNGDAHLYMGVMESFLPPNMGGKTELAKQHFERALALSGRTNLMAMVLYAEKYAKLVFDRELHDSLLNEVINADISGSKTALIDRIARARARKLLTEADDYF